jgi:hypothetical protein
MQPGEVMLVRKDGFIAWREAISDFAREFENRMRQLVTSLAL